MPSLTVINWIVGAIASIGVVGVIALAICAPAAAMALARVAGDILSTRLGLAAAVGAGCLYGGLVYGDISGRAEERTACEAKQKAAEAEAVTRDKDQGRLAADDEQKGAVELDAGIKQDKEQVDALRQADASCHPVTADQLK